jgi:hypothetical protein
MKKANDNYEKYIKGKRTTLLLTNETKEVLNDLKHDLRMKSLEDLLNYLVYHHSINK